MVSNEEFDLIIVGGGIGGVICLKYAKDAGLKTLLLERREEIGGLWRDLPPWQDIQFRKEEWTIGDLPISGELQPDILRNINSWVERFELTPDIRLNASVTRARPTDGGWSLTTDAATYRGKWLIAATGGHNIPVIPQIERKDNSIVEFHSSALRNPQDLKDKRVTVVGGGASAFDLLDLCFVHGARSVSWVYRSTKWMRPTRKSKYFATDIRSLARYQMLGMSVDAMNRMVNKDLKARYAKAGIEEIMPEGEFDFRCHQFIPGRVNMIQGFSHTDRYRGEVQSLQDHTVLLSSGEEFETDVILWGTGYSVDLAFLGLKELNDARNLNAISSRCFGGFRSIDAANLFLLAPSVLETTTSTPWAYALAAKSIMSHISGKPVFEGPTQKASTNYFDLVKLLARHDRLNYLFGFWYLKYLWLALFYPKTKPLPIP